MPRPGFLLQQRGAGQASSPVGAGPCGPGSGSLAPRAMARHPAGWPGPRATIVVPLTPSGEVMAGRDVRA